MKGSREDTCGVNEARKLLRVSVSTLLRRARAGIVPGAKIGREWVFIRDDLLQIVRQNYKKPACYIDGKALRTGGSDFNSLGEKSGSRLAQEIARKRRNSRPRLEIVHGGRPD